jgi:hypothetical protein
MALEFVERSFLKTRILPPYQLRPEIPEHTQQIAKAFDAGEYVTPIKTMPAEAEDFLQALTGFHRLKAALLVPRVQELQVLFHPHRLSRAEEIAVGARDNMDALSFSPVEEATVMLLWLNNSPGKTQVDLAVTLGKSTRYVSEKLALTRVKGELVQAYLNQLAPSHFAQLGRLPVADQPSVAEQAVHERLTVSQLRRLVTARLNDLPSAETAPKKQQKRVIQLNGKKVTFSGIDDIDAAIKFLRDAKKAEEEA